jgi:hypothetical protein
VNETDRPEGRLPPIEIDFLESYDRTALIAEMRRIADVLGKSTLSLADIGSFGRMSTDCVMKKFGSLRAAHIAAGLTPNRSFSNRELLKMLAELWSRTMEDHDRRPRATDFARYELPVSASTCVRRFGSWRKALIATSRFSVSGKVPREDSKRSLRTTISFRMRFLILQRDSYRCRICKTSGVKLEVDHIVPLSLGGSNEMHNLQALCVPCNRGKGNRRE